MKAGRHLGNLETDNTPTITPELNIHLTQVSGLWEKVGELGENPRSPRENLQTAEVRESE